MIARPRQSVARALFLALVALFFGGQALRYPIGTLSHAGPGLFPLLISGLLLLVALASLARAGAEAARLEFGVRNIGLILLALGGFAAATRVAGAAAGVVALVGIASPAARSFSWQQAGLTAAGLIAVAWAFRTLLGLNLDLF